MCVPPWFLPGGSCSSLGCSEVLPGTSPPPPPGGLADPDVEQMWECVPPSGWMSSAGTFLHIAHIPGGVRGVPGWAETKLPRRRLQGETRPPHQHSFKGRTVLPPLGLTELNLLVFSNNETIIMELLAESLVVDVVTWQPSPHPPTPTPPTCEHLFHHPPV